MQEMVGVAEVDEFLALVVDRKKSNVPAIVRGRILDFARCLMRDDLDRHAELCCQGPPEGYRDAAIGVAVLDRELRRRRRRDGNCEPQLSGGCEFLQCGCIGHRSAPKNKAASAASVLE